MSAIPADTSTPRDASSAATAKATLDIDTLTTLSFNANFSKIEKHGVSLILDSSLDGHTLGPGYPVGESKTLLIYAERITITGSISLPGINLGLFCSTLVLPTTNVSIDVSGGTVDDRTTIPGENGQQADAGIPGKDGGCFWLYVENMTQNIAQRLKIVANGGKGGRGQSTSKNGYGGKGGKAGKGGNIVIGYGCAIQNLAVLLEDPDSKALAWADLVAHLQTSILPLFDGLDYGGVDKTLREDATSTVLSYDTYLKTLKSFSDILIQVTMPDALEALVRKSDELLDAAEECSTRIFDFLTSISPPSTITSKDQTDLDDQLTLAISSLKSLRAVQAKAVEAEKAEKAKKNKQPSLKATATNSITVANADRAVSVAAPASTFDDDIAKLNRQAKDLQNALIAKLKALTLPDNTKSSDLNTKFSKIWRDLARRLVQMQNDVKFTMPTSQAGEPGTGGTSSNPADAAGGLGDPNSAGTVSAYALNFCSYLSDDLDYPITFAFPEQCRMVLRAADQRYFSKDVASWTVAYSLYSTLERRLAFLDIETFDGGTSQLGKAYVQPDTGFQQMISSFMVDAVTQLRSVRTTAKTRLSNLKSGIDMFGHSADWVPRMNMNWYLSHAAEALTALKEVEDRYVQYQAAIQNNNKVATSTMNGLIEVDNILNQSNAMIDLLLDPDTSLITKSAYQIELYTPQLKQKRQNIKVALSAVEKEISEASGVNAQLIIDAVGQIAFAPTKLNAIAQFGISAYRASQEIPNAQGITINKHYVVRQVISAGKTLTDLVEDYSRSSDGSLALDDPGSTKILTSQAEVDELLKNYYTVVSQKASDALVKEIKDYVQLANDRNSAVLEYNTQIAFLVQAQSDRAYATKNKAVLEDKTRTIDSKLPAIMLWLETILDSLKLTTMRYLDNAHRATFYWQLAKQPDWISIGPLSTYDRLHAVYQNLLTNRTKAVEKYSDQVYQKWTRLDQKGLSHKLTPSELKTLLSPITIDKKKVWSTQVTLDPNDPAFAGHRSNTRLSSIAFFLSGAQISQPNDSGDRILNTIIIHSGIEKLFPSKSTPTPLPFTHDPIEWPFSFYADRIRDVSDCINANIFGEQKMSLGYPFEELKDASAASVGPFTTWTLRVRQEDHASDVDMSGVTGAWLMFWGGNGD